MNLREGVPGRVDSAGWACVAGLALAAAGGAATRPGGWLVGLPPPAAVAGLLAATAGAAAARPRWGRLGLGLLPFLVVLAFGLPPGQAPAWSGPLLWVPLLAWALLASGGRLAPALFVPVVLAVHLTQAARVQSQVGPEGDEPHYLMVAESLLRDGDLALERDYAEGRYRAFYRSQPTLEPHYLVRGRNGEIFSQHALGLSLLVLPAFALAGYPGASFFMALLSVLLALETRRLLRSWLPGSPAAELLAWLLALGPPLVGFAGLVFTEVPAALALVFALNRLDRPRELGLPRALAVGLALAFVPWLNVRYLPFPLLLLAHAAWGRPRLRQALALALPLVVSALASAAFHQALYGFADPTRVYGKRPGFAWTRVPGNLEALLLDQEFGLLPYGAVLALAVPGAVLLARRQGLRRAFVALAPVAVVLFTAASWRMWWGGFTPPARFLVPVAPLLALCAAHALGERLSARAALLAGWTLVSGLAAVAQPHLVHRDRDGTAPLFRELSGAVEWTRLLPRFVIPEADPARHRLALLWAVGLTWAAWPRRRGSRTDEVRLATASAGALALAAVAGLVSTGRADGREAFGTLGRPALRLPGGGLAWAAEWLPADLGWDGLYEPHRNPAGRLIGGRLPVSGGDLELVVEVDPLPGFTAPDLVWRGEPAPAGGGRLGLDCSAGACRVRWRAPAGQRAVSLFLTGGGPALVRRLQLWAAQP